MREEPKVDLFQIIEPGKDEAREAKRAARELERGQRALRKALARKVTTCVT